MRLSGPNYWSLGEEWERHTEELQGLSPRECYAKHRIQGGLVALHTVEVKPPRTTAEMKEQEFEALVNGYQLGQRYLVERKEPA